MKIYNKGATEWTVGKLVAIILLVLIIVLIVYGVSIGAFNPLSTKVKNMYNGVMSYFGGTSSTGGSSELSERVNIPGVGEGTMTFVPDENLVKVVLDNEISGFGKTFSYHADGKIYYWFNKPSGHWVLIDSYSSSNLQEGERQKNAYNSLYNLLRELLFGSPTAQWNNQQAELLMSKNIYSFGFFIEGSTGGGVYIEWENGKWYKLESNKWIEKSWSDNEALRQVYAESDDTFNDDVVYVRVNYGGRRDILTQGNTVLVDRFSKKGEDYYPFSRLAGMQGDLSEIDSEADFQNLVRIFQIEKQALLQRQSEQASLFNTVKAKAEQKTVEFNGRQENIGFNYYGDKPYLYISKENPRYGLAFTSPDEGYRDYTVNLFVYSNGAWTNVPGNSNIYMGDAAWENVQKITKIKDFLKSMWGE